MARARRAPEVIGWREWIQLPELSAVPVKAKIDTGAATSALHAFDLQIIETDDGPVASFEHHPVQRSALDAVRVTVPIEGFRRVRSSNGKVETRPFIKTPVTIGSRTFRTTVTLTARDAMGFRMLLGRSALRRRYLVDPGRAFLLNPEPS